MSGINPIGTNYNFQQLAATPAPSQSGWSKFGSVLQGVGSSLPVVGGAISSLGSGSSASFDRQYQMIMLQQEIQMQSQTISTMSNISKAKHEASMASIRNIK